MNQWKNEITTKVRSGTIDVTQHYGPNRESSARRLARKDVVITTYHVVMWDQKNHQNTVSIPNSMNPKIFFKFLNNMFL